MACCATYLRLTRNGFFRTLNCPWLWVCKTESTHAGINVPSFLIICVTSFSVSVIFVWIKYVKENNENIKYWNSKVLKTDLLHGLNIFKKNLRTNTDHVLTFKSEKNTYVKINEAKRKLLDLNLLLCSCEADTLRLYVLLTQNDMGYYKIL